MPTFDSKQPEFRPALHEDRELLVGLIQAYYKLDQIDFDESAIRGGLAELLSDGRLGQVWFIEHGGRVAGYMILTFAFDLEFGGREGTLTDLYFLPEFRRMGLGSAALRQLEATCAGLGLKAIELRVETDNHEAQGLYMKHGYRKHERFTLSKKLNAIPFLA